MVPPGLADPFPSCVSTAVFISIAPLTRSYLADVWGKGCAHMEETLCVPWPPWAHGLQDAADLNEEA